MASNSEARKSFEEKRAQARLEQMHRARERRREVARDALAAVYSGAGMLEADALIDQLDTLGARIEVQP